MIRKIRTLIKNLYLKRLIKRGLKVGNNFQMEKACNIDANFPWLIEIGNNVTMASWVYLMAHDGAAQKHCGYSRVGKIKIGDNVFIGARSIIYPNVSIGNNSVIAAGSIVTKSVPENTVYAGVPAKFLMTIEDYENKLNTEKASRNIYEFDYTLGGGITENKKNKMRNDLEDNFGFIV